MSPESASTEEDTSNRILVQVLMESSGGISFDTVTAIIALLTGRGVIGPAQ